MNFSLEALKRLGTTHQKKMIKMLFRKEPREFIGGEILVHDIQTLFRRLDARIDPTTGYIGVPSKIFKSFAELLLMAGLIKARNYTKRKCPRGRIETQATKRVKLDK